MGGKAACLLLLLVAACATSPGGRVSTAQNTAGSAGDDDQGRPLDPRDPWGGYIHEASERFDVPEVWIRTVIRIESGGHTRINGKLITSPKGAMGLMQLVPGTYDEMRAKYGLGPDPYNPRDNIMAGTAYIREMYEVFGSPGFLGAYNCGPACYGDFVAGARHLPAETRNYIKMGQVRVASAEPKNRGVIEADPSHPGVMTAMREQVQIASATPDLTVPEPAAVTPPAPPAPIMVASASPAPATVIPAVARPEPPPLRPSPIARPATKPASIILASAIVPPLRRPFQGNEPVVPVPPPSVTPIALRVSTDSMGSHNLVAELAAKRPNESWGVQVGAFTSKVEVDHVVAHARGLVPDILGKTHLEIAEIQTSGKTLFRTQLLGLSEGEATTACQRLMDKGSSCVRVRLA
ncbi:MAG: lytic transglycosylase domain-containing protein [Azospirillaceae bacterium]|nr:lytic transglycosylase domain-containing protein [Azospirillaceae bacterium]